MAPTARRFPHERCPISACSAPRLVEALDRLARERPLDRKLVVAPTFGGGRELLRRLALEGSGWIGFEVTTDRKSVV